MSRSIIESIGREWAESELEGVVNHLNETTELELQNMGRSIAESVGYEWLIGSIGYEWAEFTLDGFINHLNETKQINIVLHEEELPHCFCGGWMKGKSGQNFIFCNGSLLPFQREHVVLHEIGHMVCGHRTLSKDEVLRWSDDWFDNDNKVDGRAVLDIEREAETFAILCGLKAHPLDAEVDEKVMWLAELSELRNEIHQYESPFPVMAALCENEMDFLLYQRIIEILDGKRGLLEESRVIAADLEQSEDHQKRLTLIELLRRVEDSQPYELLIKAYCDVAESFRAASRLKGNLSKLEGFLTQGEFEVVGLLVDQPGASIQNVASELNLSVSSIKWRLNSVYKKLDISSSLPNKRAAMLMKCFV